VVDVVKGMIGIALLAAAIAFGVKWATDKGTSGGPTVVTVAVPNPMGGGGGGDGGDQILVP
jgi:hypothetical protein